MKRLTGSPSTNSMNGCASSASWTAPRPLPSMVTSDPRHAKSSTRGPDLDPGQHRLGVQLGLGRSGARPCGGSAPSPGHQQIAGRRWRVRAFIDDAGVRACMQVMSIDWIEAANGHGADLKRLLRCYVALIAASGIRSGLEAKRIRLGDIRFVTQEGRGVIIIRVIKDQGKHPKARSVVLFEGNPALRLRHLVSDLIAWRRSQGATETDFLFARPITHGRHFGMRWTMCCGRPMR